MLHPEAGPRQAKRLSRLKSVSKHHKESASGYPTARASLPHAAQQQSHSMTDVGSAALSLPVSVSTLEAHVGSIPHSQLVQHTMAQLTRTLSSEPRAAEPAQRRFTDMNTSTAPPGTASFTDASSVPKQPQIAESAQHQQSQHGMPIGVSPVLQPFLSSPLDQKQAGYDTPTPAADEVSPQQLFLALSDATAGDDTKQLPARLTDVEGQSVRQADSEHAEGEINRQNDGQSQEQRAASPADKAEQGASKAHTGTALQQLIARAQKLKEQLDAHAERRSGR